MDKVVQIERIESKIFQIRGKRVMLDMDLAELYGVPTKQLTRQVRRNLERFPDDFMFKLTNDEFLRCQFGASSYGGRRYLPYAFTEQGVAMLSGVLHSRRAVQVNIAIMRAFFNLRHMLSTNKELMSRLNELERKTEKHDVEIQSIFEAIRQLMAPPPEPPKRMIGFKQD